MILWFLFSVFFILFLRSFLKERRLFRNAVYFTISLLLLLFAVAYSLHGSIVSLLIVVSVFILLPLSLIPVSFVFIAAGIQSIKRDGFSLAHSLSVVCGLGIWGLFFAVWLMISGGRHSLFEFELLFLILSVAAYVLFTFAALLIYSLLYQIVPKNKNCDFIIVHGAGLTGGRKVSPLLAGRLDKGIQMYELSQRKAKLIVSGGKGGDEAISEAQAMKNYLLEQDIPESSILMEDESRTTMENMQFSKKLMDGLMQSYRCIFVTSDYHVFRAGTYARIIGLKAEGVGSKTAFYYWPNAFIREYIAVIVKYKRLPAVCLGLWAIAVFLTSFRF